MELALERSAILRRALSRPVRLALEAEILTAGSTFFDYGCGHGEDVAGLRAAGFVANGWDPLHRPDAAVVEADVVNLGYVVNVIPTMADRVAALRRAWGLARTMLIVAARLRSEEKLVRRGRPHGDGIVTGSATFQKFFQQAELRAWIEEVVGRDAIAAAPGVFLIFRREEDANRYLLRGRRQRRVHVTVSRANLLYDQHKEVLDELIRFFEERGRLPREGEVPSLEQSIRGAVKSTARAWRIVQEIVDSKDWDRVAAARREDVLVELALLKLNRRPSYTALPTPTQHDIRAFFGSYKRAEAEADELLFSVGDLEVLVAAASKVSVGKRTPTDLYVHRSAVDRLPPVLRVYEGCARWLAGDVEDGDVIKLALDKPKVSYLSYPTFDRDPHPVLARSTFVKLGQLYVGSRDYSESSNPPILHRKETFVADDYPLREKFASLTAQEERFGLFDEPVSIGTLEGWSQRLDELGVRLRGHRVVRWSPARDL